MDRKWDSSLSFYERSSSTRSPGPRTSHEFDEIKGGGMRPRKSAQLKILRIDTGGVQTFRKEESLVMPVPRQITQRL